MNRVDIVTNELLLTIGSAFIGYEFGWQTGVGVWFVLFALLPHQ